MKSSTKNDSYVTNWQKNISVQLTALKNLQVYEYIKGLTNIGLFTQDVSLPRPGKQKKFFSNEA